MVFYNASKSVMTLWGLTTNPLLPFSVPCGCAHFRIGATYLFIEMSHSEQGHFTMSHNVNVAGGELSNYKGYIYIMMAVISNTSIAIA